MEIRIIKIEEAEIYWNFRLFALQESPEAFGGAYEEVCSTPIEVIKSRIQTTDENYMLGAFLKDNKLIGMIGFRREQGLKVRHKAIIWGMFVHPEYRGKGVGKQLLQQVLERSKNLKDLDNINLCVVNNNKPAKQLYSSLGFKRYGTERNALKHNGQDFDEDLMTYSCK